jgi:hypothetical protein
VTCRSALWVDAVGLHHIAGKLEQEERDTLYGALVKCIYEEAFSAPRRYLGILLDGGGRERKCDKFDGIDVKYAKALYPIVYAGLHVEYVWYVRKDDCEYARVHYHELYSALCKCDRDDWLVVAECDCSSLKEGAIGSKLQGRRDCGRCLLLVTCPARQRPTAPR